MASETRSSLLHRLRDFGDTSGWREFVRLYQPLLVAYARRRGLRRADAEEIAQQCLGVVVRRIGSFQRRRRFRSWLRRIVDLLVYQWLREAQRRRRVREVLLNQAERPPADEQARFATWREEWNRFHLQHCLEDLRTRFTTETLRAFELYVLRDFPVPTITRLLHISENQVYVAKSRVLQYLRTCHADALAELYLDEG